MAPPSHWAICSPDHDPGLSRSCALRFTITVTASAQQVFRELLRTVVAPGLRKRGLRGSGQSYLLPDEVVWAQVGFQKSRASTAEAVRFTVNLNITDKAAWDEVRREHSYVKDKPPPGVDPGDWDKERLAKSYYPKRPPITGGEGTRIGQVMPGVAGGDHWWVVTPQSTDAVDDALQAVVRHGLPWLIAQVTASRP